VQDTEEPVDNFYTTTFPHFVRPLPTDSQDGFPQAIMVDNWLSDLEKRYLFTDNRLTNK